MIWNEYIYFITKQTCKEKYVGVGTKEKYLLVQISTFFIKSKDFYLELM